MSFEDTLAEMAALARADKAERESKKRDELERLIHENLWEIFEAMSSIRVNYYEKTNGSFSVIFQIKE